GVRFAHEALVAADVGGIWRVQHLQRNPAMQLRVLGDVDVAHAAAAKAAEDLVVGERGADHLRRTGAGTAYTVLRRPERRMDARWLDASEGGSLQAASGRRWPPGCVRGTTSAEDTRRS